MTNSPKAKPDLVLVSDKARDEVTDDQFNDIEDLGYLLTPERGKRLRGANLNAKEWNLWVHLVTLAPFKYRLGALPPIEDVLPEIDMNRAEFFYAIAKFEEHGILAFLAGYSHYQYF
jgi:hypothetical protein